MARGGLHIFFARIAHQVSVGVKREFPAPHRCVISMPGGFPYEAYDGRASVKPWHILALVDASRALAFCTYEDDVKSFLDFKEVYSDTYGFIGSTRLDINPLMYDTAIPKAPLKVDKKLLYHGTSSMNMMSSIINSEDVVLAKCQQQTIAVAKDTRRPTALPDWWKQKYLDFNDGQSALRIHPSDRPDQSDISLHPVTVNASDTDPYSHVNWTAYLKFCLDGAAANIFKRNPNPAALNLYRPVESAELMFVSEAILGDNLRVEFWHINNDELKFEILNSEQKVVTRASVKYFDKL